MSLPQPSPPPAATGGALDLWLGRLHLTLGLVGAIVFLATGQYMDRFHAHLRGMADGPRLLFRSAHIYLLLSSLLNLVLGIYATPARGRLRRTAQRLGSVLIALGPPLFLAAFFNEPWLRNLARPYTRWAVLATFAGAIAHLASARRPRPGEVI
jgi:hypothetical protein